MCTRSHLITSLQFSMLNKAYFPLCNADTIYSMSKKEPLWFAKGVIH
ncbi:hypothetical protein HMPREF1621_01502 [Escherichia coli A25922R]|nr:hypothetical protein HMPREF1607_01436 [Escherichia coli 908524]ESE35980.1 hypothetical protein HMPREF1621_01502 [Escherichia coli A25922R]